MQYLAGTGRRVKLRLFSVSHGLLEIQMVGVTVVWYDTVECNRGVVNMRNVSTCGRDLYTGKYRDRYEILSTT